MLNIEVGNVIETTEFNLITREDNYFVYARRVYPYIQLGDEFIMFTKLNIEKEMSAIGFKKVIDMNEVTRRYLELA